MTHFRPCIDLHDGRVKQIVGSTLSEDGVPRENFVSDKPPAWFAEQYARDGLTGGHVIMLGKGNEQAATDALAAFPGGLQVGGGIHAQNAALWLERGASHVIVTSSVFDANGNFAPDRLQTLVNEVGADRIVLDLSCKASPSGWRVAMNRWQTLTDLEVTTATLDMLADSCAEFLVHAVDVEGKCEGIDHDLARFLGAWGKRPLTYAGGISRLDDLWAIQELSAGVMDATVGSALDLFGGNGVRYDDCVRFSRAADEKGRLRVVMKRKLVDRVDDVSDAVRRQLMENTDWLPTSGVVALFGGLQGEPDLLPLIPWLNERSLRVAFMDFDANGMTPRLISDPSQLKCGNYGALVPDASCPAVGDADIQVILTPGLAFGEHGERLGRGRGYYDRFFARVPGARRVGVCAADQIVRYVPCSSHDARMHFVVTEAAIVPTLAH
ncbi:MAG: phosphoribosylformimino-5-aminoimidazole carboxamide ribotide isomerase [Verrucomicrobiaceae bacterium]|nr:phosphoribosylformimino-5-aminoimidazole carboxamide ribotide isomerase [Verrucomicrobiaceae bacterium]